MSGVVCVGFKFVCEVCLLFLRRVCFLFVRCVCLRLLVWFVKCVRFCLYLRGVCITVLNFEMCLCLYFVCVCKVRLYLSFSFCLWYVSMFMSLCP